MCHRLSKGRRIVTEISRALRGYSKSNGKKACGQRKGHNQDAKVVQVGFSERKRVGKAEACRVKGSLAVR